MGTMGPLGSVLGWIFALVGLLVVIACFANVLAEAPIDNGASNILMWIFAFGLAALVAGVVFIVVYWGGGA